ncbi:rhodopsin [Halapricum salinum]|uniref:Rhodopsin n=2 Tax=Halapricum salinum TaxID=1457250 RepID=A0A4D6HEP7_9EURY|nr:bacteriorhodopsin [Halapricum salinum]QCC51522.1 rhodopsin [Halapricum salinum]
MAQGSETTWLWIGTAGMLLGMLYFIARGYNVKDERRQKFYIVTTFIAGIAFTNYLAMATGFGVIDLTDIAPWLVGTEFLGDKTELLIYWPRYTDWILTTPLLLYDLALLAGADRNTIATLVGLDVMMILTGLVATLTVSPVNDSIGIGAHRIIWWGVSCGFFLALIFYLFRGLADRASQLSGQTKSTFNTLRYMIVGIWFVYPVWWIVGTEGLGVVGLPIETAGFMVLDLTAKVGFGIILLRSHSVLDDAGTSQAAPA